MITSSFDTDRNLVLLKLSGNVNTAEVAAGYEAMFEKDGFQPNMHAVWDLSDVDFKRIPLSDVRQLPRELRRFMTQRGEAYKAALVTRRATDFQLLRIYMTIFRLIGSNFQLRLFRNLEEAYDWIGSN